jgi:hypothetical protein
VATVKIVLYLLATITCLGCTVLLYREFQQRRHRLLLWSALCFVGLSISNLLMFVDLVILPETDLRAWRLVANLGGMLFLLYGFIWEAAADEQ